LHAIGGLRADLCRRQSGQGQQRDRRAARHLSFANNLPTIFTA
jgi:hypothetical protein